MFYWERCSCLQVATAEIPARRRPLLLLAGRTRLEGKARYGRRIARRERFLERFVEKFVSVLLGSFCGTGLLGSRPFFGPSGHGALQRDAGATTKFNGCQPA